MPAHCAGHALVWFYCEGGYLLNSFINNFSDTKFSLVYYSMDAKVGNLINSPSQIEILPLEDCDQFTVRDAEGIEAMAVWWAIYFAIEGEWLVVINAICWASEMHITSRAHSWRREMARNSHESMQILIYQ